MIIFPAIDIRGGACVRLIEGDYDRETVFDEDPVEAAKRWIDAGASHIHIVDLDGARDGAPANSEAIRRIREAVPCYLQVGGGIRTQSAAADLLEAGIDRIVVGSLVLSEPSLVETMAATWPARVAIGLDARNGKLATNGWTDQSDVDVTETARSFLNRGLTTFVFTDIHRDGKLAGPNIEALRQMTALAGAEIIASGGISSIQDVDDVAATGVTGVIIGRALYDRRIDLASVLKWQ